MRKIYTITLLLLMTTAFYRGHAQCNIVNPAVAGIMLDYISTNLLNCSGVGYNPILQRYYAVRAGNAAYPLETWTSTGGQLYTTNAGWDWRGMWWNPLTNQLEGNGYATSGIWKCDLDGVGYALNTGSQIFTGQAQPDLQSVGDFDFYSNEIIYYFSGQIYRYSRATDAFLGSFPITGTPVALSNLNSNTVVFTGCVGKEIGLLDYINKRVYFYSKATGAYQGMSQLPSTTAVTSTFRFSYANGLAWFFNLSLGNWYSFRVLDWILPENAFTANTIWVSTQAAQISWQSIDAERYDYFEVERSIDGENYEFIGAQTVDDASSTDGFTKSWTLQDATAPDAAVIYYRIKAHTKSGDTEYSDVMTLLRDSEQEAMIEVWPNPGNQAVNISFSGAGNGARLDVIDASGKLVYSATAADANESSGGLSLDTQDWAEGIYMLRLSDLGGKQTVKRLVIQH